MSELTYDQLLVMVASEISGAPFPSKRSLSKAEAVLSTIYSALREPTSKMVEAGENCDPLATADGDWRAMLDASPLREG
jgi:hypothetical protein